MRARPCSLRRPPSRWSSGFPAAMAPRFIRVRTAHSHNCPAPAGFRPARPPRSDAIADRQSSPVHPLTRASGPAWCSIAVDPARCSAAPRRLKRRAVHRPRGADAVPQHAEPPCILQGGQRANTKDRDRRHGSSTNWTRSPGARIVGGSCIGSKFWKVVLPMTCQPVRMGVAATAVCPAATVPCPAGPSPVPVPAAARRAPVRESRNRRSPGRTRSPGHAAAPRCGAR